jgi:hypothetical protein
VSRALLVVAIAALLAVLAARAAASQIGPIGDTTPYEPVDASDDDGDELDDAPTTADRALYADAVAPARGDRADGGAPGDDVRAPRLPRATADEVGESAAGVPPVSAVVAAAYRAAGLAHDPTPSWRLRTRLAGLVPAVTVRDGRDAAWRDISDPTIAYVSVFSVGAQWHLERLLFDPNELRISAIEAGRRRDRRRLSEAVIRTYYAWLRLRTAAAADSRWALRADEAAAELDALTDGWFSQNLPATPDGGHAVRE